MTALMSFDRKKLLVGLSVPFSSQCVVGESSLTSSYHPISYFSHTCGDVNDKLGAKKENVEVTVALSTTPHTVDPHIHAEAITPSPRRSRDVIGGCPGPVFPLALCSLCQAEVVPTPTSER